jgi:hypothetical protein
MIIQTFICHQVGYESMDCIFAIEISKLGIFLLRILTVQLEGTWLIAATKPADFFSQQN